MSWLTLLQILLSLSSAIMDYMRQRELLNLADSAILARNLEESIRVLQRVSSARDAALREHDARNGVPDESDPNLRD